MNSKMGTTGQIISQLNQEGYPVTAYALRRWIKQGMIPFVSSGNKKLIVYAHVLEYLTTGSVTTNT